MNNPLIRKIYLYLFALVGLTLVTIGAVRLLGLGLKTFIFTKADIFYEYPAARPIKVDDKALSEVQPPSPAEVEEFQKKTREANRQREAAESLAMIIAGVPLYAYHWRLIKKDKEESSS